MSDESTMQESYAPDVITESYSGGGDEFNDFFSESFVDDYGNPIQAETTAEPVNEIPTVQAGQQNQQAQAPAHAAVTPPAAAPLPPAIQSALFGADGKIDLAKASEFFNKARSFAFPNVSAPAPAQSQAPAKDIVADVSRQMREELQSYESNIRASLLSPLESVWNAELSRGAQPGDPHMIEIQRRYQAEEAKIREHIDGKRSEYEDKRLERVLGEREKALSEEKTATRAEAVQRALEVEAGGREQYIALMFGQVDQTTGNVINGPGAEVVQFLYAAQNGDKASADATPEEYQQWWRTVQANEPMARMAYKLATAVNALHNMDGIIAAARQSWEAEAAQRKQGAMRPPGGGAAAAPAPAGNGNNLPPEVARFAGVQQF